MIKVTEQMIEMLAPNSGAIANGKKIAQKGGFIKLSKDQGETLIFGQCSGSGKDNYATSVDFADPDNPVFRCNCPSRQFPCKHGLAILFEYLGTRTFEVAEIPADLASKREKMADRQDKKEQAVAKPKTVNKAALAKKTKKQLEGLDVLEQFANDVLTTGVSTLSGAHLSPCKNLTKQLGDYYLPGPQALMKHLLILANQLTKHPEDEAWCHYEMTQRLVEIKTIAKKARVFLGKKLAEDDVLVEDSTLYEHLGYIWQLDQLKNLGLFKENVHLAQLSFQVLYDESRDQYVDQGYWMDLESGEISKTENLRPLKALKHLKEDDTVLERVDVPTLYYYPGGGNRRIRWEGFNTSSLEAADFQKIRTHAATSLALVAKEVKNQIKNALSEKMMVYALAYHQIAKIGEAYVLQDLQGDAIILQSPPGWDDTTKGLPYLPVPGAFDHQVLVGAFYYDHDAHQLYLMPQAIVMDQAIIRLLY